MKPAWGKPEAGKEIAVKRATTKKAGAPAGRGLLLHVPFADSVNAACAAGDGKGTVHKKGAAPKFEADKVRAGARFGRDTVVYYQVKDNFNRREGTVMMWFKPDWAADFKDTLGRILWDLRIEHGSVVKDDPSQRWAIVYPNPAGKRHPRTRKCWRFCIATNRNQYVIGTKRRRPDKRTRQAVFGSQQKFRAGEWLHLAVTWTKDKAAIYVDGKLDKVGKLTEGLPDRPLPKRMQIGAVASWINAGACGVISDLRIYGKALDAWAIKKIMNVKTPLSR